MQQADTGTKMIHLGKNTKSRIVSKGISAGKSQKHTGARSRSTQRQTEVEILHNVIAC